MVVETEESPILQGFCNMPVVPHADRRHIYGAGWLEDFGKLGLAVWLEDIDELGLQLMYLA